jgi:hypothetical protein
MKAAEAGAVAIWHDIVPEGLDVFYAWHGREHMPERAGIPGFRLGRRFIAVDADRAFFNLYETESAAVIRGADYRARLNNPTPWTTEAVRHFRHVARALCRVAWHAGAAEGGTLATLRFVPADDESTEDTRLIREVLAPLSDAPGVAAVRLLLADTEASGEMTAEKRARGGSTEVPTHVVVAEGWSAEDAVAGQLREALSPDRLAALGLIREGVLGLYRHQITVRAPAGA